MINVRPILFGLIVVLSLGAHATNAAEKLPKSEFRDIIWDDLLPEDMFDDIFTPAATDHTLVFENKPLEEGMVSKVMATVIPEMNGQAIRIPGFVVPLEFDEELTITEFFLVPYFGACIHSPAPPPNQIIFVRTEEGFKLDDLFTPFWVSGVMSTELVENTLAASAYTIDMQYLEEYTDW